MLFAAVPVVGRFRAPLHPLFIILIQAHLSFHISEVLFFFFSPLPPFFSLNIACPVQQMWGSDPTSIEVNSQIPIDFAESESEPLSGEQGLELSRSK